MTVLHLHAESMRDEWRDAYGHLNEAYYLVPFSNAAWPLQEHFGIGVPYFERTGCAIYTVETHLRYLREVRAPAQLEIASMMLHFDAKRLHFAHVMNVDGVERATFECLALHYDTRAGRTAEMPAEVQDALREACVETLPDWVGRRISMEQR